MIKIVSNKAFKSLWQLWNALQKASTRTSQRRPWCLRTCETIAIWWNPDKSECSQNTFSSTAKNGFRSWCCQGCCPGCFGACSLQRTWNLFSNSVLFRRFSVVVIFFRLAQRVWLAIPRAAMYVHYLIPDHVASPIHWFHVGDFFLQ